MAFMYYVVLLANLHGHTGTVVGSPSRFPSLDACEESRRNELAELDRGHKYPAAATVYISDHCIYGQEDGS